MLPCEAPESFLSTVSYTPVVKVTMTRPPQRRTHARSQVTSSRSLSLTEAIRGSLNQMIHLSNVQNALGLRFRPVKLKHVLLIKLNNSIWMIKVAGLIHRLIHAIKKTVTAEWCQDKVSSAWQPHLPDGLTVCVLNDASLLMGSVALPQKRCSLIVSTRAGDITGCCFITSLCWLQWTPPNWR